jgi:hypothetical protein
MDESVIKRIHAEFKDTKKFTLPDSLLPFDKGYNLVSWAKELFVYYRTEEIIVRPFDDLPGLRLSNEEGLTVTIQDIHKFIINDLNLISLETRKKVIEQAVSGANVQESWENIVPLLLPFIKNLDKETLMEELSWKCGPVLEILWALSWIFMEREQIEVPEDISMVCSRFPYFQWQAKGDVQSMWEPEAPICRREWLALDLYNKSGV